VTAAAGGFREAIRVRQLFAGIGVAVNAAERSVNRAVERFGVDGDAAAVRPLRVSVAVAGEAVFVGR